MMRRLLYGLGGFGFGLVSAFFVTVLAYITSSEIIPAVRNGSLNVETNTMILNIVWEGNEIYILVMAYLLIACGCAYAAYRLIRKAVAA